MRQWRATHTWLRRAHGMPVDVVRGLAMILMAIGHVRVYSGLPPGGPTPGICRSA